MVTMTVALTAGPYNGSTFSVAGRVVVYDDKAEAAVVGGTGRLRRAAGYLTWRMVELVVSEKYVMVEVDVHMSVPPVSAAGGNWWSSLLRSLLQNMLLFQVICLGYLWARDKRWLLSRV